MKQALVFPVILFVLALLATAQPKIINTQALAQEPTADFEEVIDLEPVATDAADATDSAEASPAAQVEQRIIERRAEDITDTTGETRGKLSTFLGENPIGPLSWHNFLQHAIRDAVSKGLSASIIVLLLLFPIIASIIAASRHVVGLRGFGIYIPAVLSVAFVSTEIVTGIIIFVAVIFASIISRAIVQKFRLPYLPRTAMLLWGVSIFILALLIFSSQMTFFQLLTINIFPILIIIILTENFMNSQLFTSQREALKIALETLFIAIICSLIISQEGIQKFVLLWPELVLVATVVVNYLIGKYTGLRLIELARFSTVLGQNNLDTPSQDDQAE
jgi:hypothetical protein